VKKAIVDAVKTPLEHPELVKKYKVKPIKGILMFGPPGGGKTMLMRAVGNELKGVTILQINGAEISQEGIGRATATVKEIFNRAIENAPSILFIDELDGIAPKRRGATEEGVQFTSELLQEMDGFMETPGVVLVCATNRPSALDAAILRPGRFDKLIFVGPPNQQQRELMFKSSLESVPTSEDVNLKELANETEGYTGADIANICREAAQKALDESIKTGKDAKVEMANLLNIIKMIKPSAPEKLVKSYQAFLDKYGQR
jgi:transitional endoplasmic reticulum ATPase